MDFTFIWTGFLIGLTGTGHCLLMCGPLILTRVQNNSYLNNLLYHLGRISSYLVIGFIFGLISEVIKITVLQQYTSIIAGILLLTIYLTDKYNLLSFRILPIKKLGLFFHSILPKKLQSFGNGIVNGFLPCGLVYLAVTASLQGGSQYYSILYMLAFGMGTLPVLFMLPFVKKIPQFNRFRIPYGKDIAIISISILFIIRGLGLGIPYLSPKIELAKQESKEIHSCCSHKETK